MLRFDTLEENASRRSQSIQSGEMPGKRFSRSDLMQSTIPMWTATQLQHALHSLSDLEITPITSGGEF